MACDMPIRRQTTIVTVTYGDRLIYLRRLIEQAFAFEQITRVVVVSNASRAPLEQLTSRWPGSPHHPAGAEHRLGQRLCGRPAGRTRRRRRIPVDDG